MNGFEKHGMEYTSVSQVQEFQGSPTVYSIKYLGKIKFDGSPATWSGDAVEDGAEVLLHGGSVEEAVKHALVTYRTKACEWMDKHDGEIPDGLEKREALIPGAVEQVKQYLAGQVFELVSCQKQINHWLDGVPVPFKGYIDFRFTTALLDLKTTLRMPDFGIARPDHTAQVALYSDAEGVPPIVLYVSDKKFLPCPISEEDCIGALENLRANAIRLERFLSAVDNVTHALSMLPAPDPGFWKVDRETLVMHRKLVGAL